MNHPIRNAFLVGGIIIAIAVGSYAVFHKTNHSTNEAIPITRTVSTLGGQIFVRVAETPAEQALGLSYIKSMYVNQGMLFVFDKSDIYHFWMKDMNFPLDIVWLKSVDSSGFTTGDYYKVVSISRNTAPESYPKTFEPAGPADAVLEINAGRAGHFGITEGQTITVLPFISDRMPVLNP